jgi:hypothetical protein
MHVQFLGFILLLRQRFQIINSQILEVKVPEEKSGILKNPGLFRPLIKQSSPFDSHQKYRHVSTKRIRTSNSATNLVRLRMKIKEYCHQTSTINDERVSVKFASQFLCVYTTSLSERWSRTEPSEEQRKTSQVGLLAHLHDSPRNTVQLLNTSFSVLNLLCSTTCLDYNRCSVLCTGVCKCDATYCRGGSEESHS